MTNALLRRRAPCRLRCLGRRGLAALLLAVLVIQISPLAIRQEPAALGREAQLALCFEPLDVCGDGDSGGALADHSWLPVLALEARVLLREVGFSPEASPLLAPGHPLRLLRPPRA